MGRNNLYTFQHSHRNELVATTLTVWKTTTFRSLNPATTKNKEKKKEELKLKKKEKITTGISYIIILCHARIVAHIVRFGHAVKPLIFEI